MRPPGSALTEGQTIDPGEIGTLEESRERRGKRSAWEHREDGG
jgi:hypothetical protein